MKAWKGNKSLLALLKADSEVITTLPQGELEPLFDYQYYLRHVDDVFARLGLTKVQWKGRIAEPEGLAPRAI